MSLCVTLFLLKSATHLISLLTQWDNLYIKRYSKVCTKVVQSIVKLNSEYLCTENELLNAKSNKVSTELLVSLFINKVKEKI